MSFQEKREQWSRNDKISVLYSTKDAFALGIKLPDYFYAVPNETDTDSVIEKIDDHFDNYYGVIGGVLANVKFVGALDAKNHYLTDISEKAIDHLAFMLYTAPKNGDTSSFVRNIASLDFDEKRIEEFFGKDSKGNLPDFSLYTSKNREYIAKRVDEYISSQPAFIKEGLQKLHSSLEDDRLFAFRSDISKLSFEPDSFVYLSNINNVSSQLKKRSQCYWRDRANAYLYKT